MYDSDVVEIRKTYAGEDWFEHVTDAQIYSAWGMRSEDLCASWLAYHPGERDPGFESYLKGILKREGPLDMMLFCPNCTYQHIDAKKGEWRNPPHKSHLCEACGFIWRPADVPTNGVEKTQTKGEKDGQKEDSDLYVFTGEELIQLLSSVRNRTASIFEEAANAVFRIDFRDIIKGKK